MFYDKKRQREEGKVTEVLFWELNVIVEGKAWDKN